MVSNKDSLDYSSPSTVIKLISDTYMITNNYLNEELSGVTRLSGSTGIVLFFFESVIYWSNVGDSEAALLTLNTKTNKYELKMLSKVHIPSNIIEKKRIESSGGRCEPFKMDDGSFYGPVRVWKKNKPEPGLMMTRSFGDRCGHEVGMTSIPDIGTENIDKEIHKGVIIGSDGIWEQLTKKQVADIAGKWSKEDNCAAACRELGDVAAKLWDSKNEDGHYRDDITVIVGYFK